MQCSDRRCKTGLFFVITYSWQGLCFFFGFCIVCYFNLIEGFRNWLPLTVSQSKKHTLSANPTIPQICFWPRAKLAKADCSMPTRQNPSIYFGLEELAGRLVCVQQFLGWWWAVQQCWSSQPGASAAQQRTHCPMPYQASLGATLFVVFFSG